MALSSTVQAGYYTVHTVTTHFQVEGLETFTPGFAYTNDDNIRLGALLNSYKLPSFYAAAIADMQPWLRIGFVLSTGYTIQNGKIVGKRAGILFFPAIEADIMKNASVLWMGESLNLEIKF